MMRFYGNKKQILDVAEIDTDIIAFDVPEDEVEVIVDYLVSAIMTRSIMEFGETPVILE